jgi:hypothetical protein
MRYEVSGMRYKLSAISNQQAAEGRLPVKFKIVVMADTS